jgi:DNA mismatch endonuclease, patch repair protein
MADVFSAQKRSAIMAAVKGRGNLATERRLLAILRQYRINGWRRHFPAFGNPDFVFPLERVAVFVDGCFWHGCPKHGTIPTTNDLFWRSKLERNKARDIIVNRELRRNGWRVVRVWQHELKDTHKVKRRIQRCLTLKSVRPI